MVLEAKYNTNANHTVEKRLLRKKIKKLDTLINDQVNSMTVWANNLGEAIDIME